MRDHPLRHPHTGVARCGALAGGTGPLAGILAIAVAAEAIALALAIATGAGVLAGLGLAWAGGTVGMAAGTALVCRRAATAPTHPALLQPALAQPALLQPALAQPALAQPAPAQLDTARRATLDALLREDPRCPPML